MIYTAPDQDLFATRANNQLQKFISWFPDPDALATNVFAIPWSNQLCISSLQSNYEMPEKNPVRQSQGSPHCSSVEVETVVSNSTVDAFRSPIVASQYLRPLDSSTASRENAAETSNDSCMAAVRRCLSQFYLSLRVSKHHHVHIKVLGQSEIADVLKNKKILFLVI